MEISPSTDICSKWKISLDLLLSLSFCTQTHTHTHTHTHKKKAKETNMLSRNLTFEPRYRDFMGFPGGSDDKAPACNAGDPGLIPGLGRSPGEGNGNPLQYSCLENSMDGGAWLATVHGVAKSWTQLSDFTFYSWMFSFPWSIVLLDVTGSKYDPNPKLMFTGVEVRVGVLQKPVLEKPSTTLGELENSGLLCWRAQGS